MRNAIIQFSSPTNLSPITGYMNINLTTSLSWANNNMTNTSEGNQYVTRVTFLFGKESWVKTELPPQGVLGFTFGSSATIDNEALEKSVEVFTGETQCEGTINLIAPTKPDGADDKASVRVYNSNKSYSQDVLVAWNSTLALNELCYDSYTVHTNPSGDYIGGADQNVRLSETQKSQNVTLSYTKAIKQTDLTVSVLVDNSKTEIPAGVQAPTIAAGQGRSKTEACSPWKP